MPPPLIVRRLGQADYLPTLEAMRTLTAERDASTADEIWLLEHPAVFTQGQAGKAEHVLAAGDIPVVQVERGGQVTYHGPGQLVAYLMLDIRRLDMGVRDLVSAMEQALVRLLGGMAYRPRRDRTHLACMLGRRRLLHWGCVYAGAAHSTVWPSMWTWTCNRFSASIPAVMPGWR